MDHVLCKEYSEFYYLILLYNYVYTWERKKILIYCGKYVLVDQDECPATCCNVWLLVVGSYTNGIRQHIYHPDMGDITATWQSDHFKSSTRRDWQYCREREVGWRIRHSKPQVPTSYCQGDSPALPTGSSYRSHIKSSRNLLFCQISFINLVNVILVVKKWWMIRNPRSKGRLFTWRIPC